MLTRSILPTDDPEVFLQFFKILHHQTPKLSELTGHQTLGLALVGKMRLSESTMLPWLHQRTANARSTMSRQKGFFSSMFVGDVAKSASKGSMEKRFSFADLIQIAAMSSWKGAFWDGTKQYMAQYSSDAEESVERFEDVSGVVRNGGDTVFGKLLPLFLAPAIHVADLE